MKTLISVSITFLLLSGGVTFAQKNIITGTSEPKKIKIISPEEKKAMENADIPVLRITNPLNQQKNEGVKTEVNTDLKIFNIKGMTYVRDGSGIDKVLINNEKINVSINDEFEKSVLLMGDTNKYIIESWSNNGAVAYDTIFIIYNRQTNKNYLMVMAVNDYDYWPDLKNPVNDAKAIIDVLKNKYEFLEPGIIELYNDKCNTDSIDATFRNLIGKVKETDNVLIFFAGHGYYDPILQEGYWIPSKARIQNTNDYLNNSIMMKYIAALKSRHTLIIADACFSGSLFAMDMRSEAPAFNVSNYEKRKSRWAFTSGRMEEVLDASPFAKYITEYLENSSKNQFLFSELADYVTTAVSRNSDQMPKAGPLAKVGDEGGQFVFKKKVDE